MSTVDASKLQVGQLIIVCGKSECEDLVFSFKGLSGDFLKLEPMGCMTNDVYREYNPTLKKFMKNTKDQFFSFRDYNFQVIQSRLVIAHSTIILIRSNNFLTLADNRHRR